MIPPADVAFPSDGGFASRDGAARQSPHNLEAERSVIGALLLDRDAIIPVSQKLHPQDFYLDAHGIIYGIIVEMYERRHPADYVTLADELERRDLLERVGGRQYFMNLAAQVPTALHAEYYADIVARLSVLRRLIDAGQRITAIGYDDSKEADEAIDGAEAELFAVAQRRNTHGFTSIRDVVAGYLDRLDYIHENRGAVVGVPSGFIDLDRIMGGLQRSDLIILAARPAMGKCLAWDTLIDDPRTGERATIQQFVQEQRPVVLGMSSSGGVEKKFISHWIDSGVKPCFRVRTRTGREVKVTGHHPFFTINGWTPLHDLSVGDSIAVPSAVPVFGQNSDVPEDLVRLLAYYIAEGSLSQRTPGFTNTDPVIIEDFTAIIARHFPACAIRQEKISYYAAQPKRGRAPGLGGIMPPNPVRVWLETFGIYGQRAEDKHFPACVWTWDSSRLALFLRVLMSCDGSIYRNGPANPRIEFGVASQRLANDVHHALARFGIISHLYRKTARCWVVLITSRVSVERYQREIGWIGEKASRFVDHVYATNQAGNAGHLPRAVWPMVRTAAASQGLSMSEVARRAGETTKMGRLAGYNPHARRGLPVNSAVKYASVLHLPRLAALCHTDIYWDEITQIEQIGPQQVYDLTVPDGANFVANDVFVHNTGMALSICHNTATRYKSRVAIFSLEMSAEQLVQRMLCMEGGLDSSRLRTGYINEEEWGRLIQAAAALSETDVYIDDSAGISTMEMRSKVRRLHSERQLDLIVVDYLQLMQGRSQSENRVQEISKISRELKGLAREMDVPVLALSQVSRAVDARTNHIPMLSDLRESGCLSGETPVYLPDLGVYRPIAELVGQSGFRVLALNTATWRLEPRPVTRAFATGHKPVYRLTTRLGRTVRATSNHKFLTVEGWRRLDELAPGKHIAAPRVLSGPNVPSMSDSELALLGHLIGDGCTLPRHTIQYTTHEPALAEAVARLATDVFGDAVTPRINHERQWYQVYLVSARRLTHGKRNPIAAWLDELGVFGLRSHEKRVPERVFAQPAAGIARFLRHLWATDGCIHSGGKDHYPAIYYASSSVQLCRDVQSLLLRFGINAGLRRVTQKGKGRDQYHVIVGGKADMHRFITHIGAVEGSRTERMERIATLLAASPDRPTSLDVIPATVWRLMAVPAMQAAGLTTRRMQAGLGNAYCGTHLYKNNLSRQRAARLAVVVASEQLARLANSDVYWDEIASIEPDGEEDVYDLTVDDLHCFVASDIMLHNSIEQDADVVMFIYRDKVYNPDTEKEHIADLVIAKHRHGPTGQISLFFNESQTRFVDLAPSGGGSGL